MAQHSLIFLQVAEILIVTFSSKPFPKLRRNPCFLARAGRPRAGEPAPSQRPRGWRKPRLRREVKLSH